MFSSIGFCFSFSRLHHALVFEGFSVLVLGVLWGLEWDGMG